MDGASEEAAPQVDAGTPYQPVTLKATVFDPTQEHALDVAFELFGERRRQLTDEKFDAAHDDEYTAGELERAASAYAYAAGSPPKWASWLVVNEKVERPNGGSHILETLRMLWPFDFMWWKPEKGARACLVKAGAFIIAAIEKIDRHEAWCVAELARRQAELETQQASQVTGV